MIIKSFAINNNHVNENRAFLLYGNNHGHKNEVINSLFLTLFNGEIIKMEEAEVLDKTDNLLENLMSSSLFSNSKLLIISRVTNKIFNFINQFLEKNIQEVKNQKSIGFLMLLQL